MKPRSEDLVTHARGVALRGSIAFDPERAEKRPGVLVLHEWWGHDEYVRGRARELATAGYVALSADLYGEGKKAETPEQAGALMMQVLKDPATMRARFEAARDALAAHPATDPTRLAAIGYCFGGAVVLHMARLGLDLRAVASFHPGSLATTQPAQKATLKAKLLVCLGADDPFVPADERAAFRREMAAAQAELDFVEYPGVVHGFTVPEATARGKRYGLPLAHDAGADRDSWARLERLLTRSFS